MDAVLIFSAAIVAASIIGAFIIMSRRSAETGDESPDLIRLAEEKARAESELASTRTDLENTQQQLHDARQFEIQNAKLETDIANANAIQSRTDDELKNTQSRRNQLQSDVQKLTAEISGLKAELDAKNESLREETAENTELLKQSTELGSQVNTLTAKVSNLNTELKNAEERLVERGQLEKLFGDRFKTMSSETLANQQKQFIERARETLKPLSDKVEKLDREWVNTSGAFKQQVSSLADQTRALSTALSKPQGRGQWGEIQVERVLEYSGLQEGIHYQAQAPDMKGGRTDFVVHMPHDRDIILDSKVPLVAYVDAHEAQDETQQNAHLERFARHFQDHVNNLASKEYWSNLPNAADYVVMVVPDYALPPALERRPNLLDEAHRRNVVISSQSNLVALLKTVAMGWQERKLTDEAIEIGTLGRELHDRLEVFAGHYADIGRHLERAVGGYNRGVGSLESRVLTQARRFPQLGVQSTKEIPESQPVETTIREMRILSTDDAHSENGSQ